LRSYRGCCTRRDLCPTLIGDAGATLVYPAIAAIIVWIGVQRARLLARRRDDCRARFAAAADVHERMPVASYEPNPQLPHLMRSANHWTCGRHVEAGQLPSAARAD
jgi:hypothetical protein